MEPFYFGDEPRQLFGIYHPPVPGRHRDCGVVLCYPMGQEYIRAHRAFLQLAHRLSDSGFPVLRFDFFGCGDSSGDDHPEDSRQWLDDISKAIEELKGGAGVRRMCLAGLRLGATLAARAGSERGDIAGVVLWDPVTNGRVYLREMRTQHEEWLRGSFAGRDRDASSDGGTEILGFRLPALLVSSLERENLLELPRKPADSVLLLETRTSPDTTSLVRHLGNLGARIEHHHVVEAPAWMKPPARSADEGTSPCLVPNAVLDHLVSWMSAVFS